MKHKCIICGQPAHGYIEKNGKKKYFCAKDYETNGKFGRIHIEPKYWSK